MIFVTTGTQIPFDRFIKIIDEMAPMVGEEIVAQVSKCNFEPKHIKTVNFLPPDEFNQLFEKARLIVSHAGMGTILSAMQQAKPIIIFPRIAALGEHRNEHQLATARKFKELGAVYVAMDEEELKQLLLRKDLVCLKTIGDKASGKLIDSIKDFISGQPTYDEGKRITRILNADILSIGYKELIRKLDQGVLITPNVNHLFLLQHDRELHEIYHLAEWVVCDSRVLYLCSKCLRIPIVEPIPGSSFFHAYYQHHHDDDDCRIFLLGAKSGAEVAMEHINKRVGRRIVVGAISPSMGFEHNMEENESICRCIRESGATVVVVGVGCPKQEKWIYAHKDLLPEVRLWMALGATIDFEAGNERRAPWLVQRLYLEWFYRFIQSPVKRFRRYFIDDPKFFWYFGKQLVGKYKDPFR